MRFSPDAVKRGSAALRLGLFDDVWSSGVIASLRGSGHPREGTPTHHKIEFAGNKKKDNEELEKKLWCALGSPFPVAVQAQIDSLLKLYRRTATRSDIEAVTDTTGRAHPALRGPRG